MNKAILSLLILVVVLVLQISYFLIERYKMRRYIRSVTGQRKPKTNYLKSFVWLLIAGISVSLFVLAIKAIF